MIKFFLKSQYKNQKKYKNIATININYKKLLKKKIDKKRSILVIIETEIPDDGKMLESVCGRIYGRSLCGKHVCVFLNSLMNLTTAC